MGKNPFEDMDPDLKAMSASMKPAAGPVRWGRVATGILVVGCVTFGLAYYLPLQRAHETLTRSFAQMQTQMDTANRGVKEAQAQTQEATEAKQALEGQLNELKQLDKARVEASRSATSALENKLQKPLGKNQAALASADGQAVAALSLSFLLSPGKLDVSAQGKEALCSVASAANKKTIRVLAVADKKSIPPALAAKLKTPLDYNSAVAVLVAQTLLDKCSVEPARVSATGFPAEPAANPKLEGKKLAGARVELWLDGSK